MQKHKILRESVLSLLETYTSLPSATTTIIKPSATHTASELLSYSWP